jgi:RNA polymerase sigma factor (sigma-70 family)
MNVVSADRTTADRPTRLASCLQRARDGDLSALDELVAELNPLLWHVARSQDLDAQDAADVVQTTWLELVRRLHEIREPQAISGWLVTATRREAWRVRGRSRRETPAGDSAAGLETADVADLADGVLRTDREQALWRHVQKLPERCRALLRIVALVDRPDYDAVAAALGMPRGSIGPTRGRCLAKLRALLLADPDWSVS